MLQKYKVKKLHPPNLDIYKRSSAYMYQMMAKFYSGYDSCKHITEISLFLHTWLKVFTLCMKMKIILCCCFYGPENCFVDKEHLTGLAELRGQLQFQSLFTVICLMLSLMYNYFPKFFDK